MSRNNWIALACLCLMAIGCARAERGVVVVKDGTGREIELYGGSYALLIGISDYTNGWPDLDSIPGELRRVENLLKAGGFQVVKRLDLDGQELRDAFQAFIDEHGYNPDNRLLFYFSGHGHTWLEGGQGYLVARDAPRPASPEGFPGAPFLRKTLQMSQILAWSRQLAARHALFLFDSCFSGTVFQTKALPEYPPHISRATALKVRQFITAGSAGEQVPARSVFTPAFVDALEYGWGDLNRDGYVTGMELGLYLESKVPQHARQSPQFGKHPDYELSRGDFVFALAPEAVVETEALRPRSAAPKPAVPLTLPLTVETRPQGARVRILNIVPKYRDGMELKPGQYHIEVTHPGYEKHLSWHTLQPGNEVLTVELEAEKPSELSRKPSQPNVLQPEMVGIKRGCFQMGSLSDGKDHRKDERRHRACVEDFRIGKYEVTQAQWWAVMGDSPSRFKGCDDCPVVSVSWSDAQAYLEKLNARTGKGYRLPTEAEWEYACRGGRSVERYCGGYELAALAWYRENSGEKTHPVGGKRGNGFGLYDMSGNVWEWTCSAYDKEYGGAESKCIGTDSNARRVLRGGSWYSTPWLVRAAYRYGDSPGYRGSDAGFRLAQD